MPHFSSIGCPVFGGPNPFLEKTPLILDRIRERNGPGHGHAELYEALDRFDRRHGLEARRLRPQDPYTLRREADREPAREILKQFEELSTDQRRKLPALCHSMARMRAVCGDLEGALEDLRELWGELSRESQSGQFLGNEKPVAIPSASPSLAPPQTVKPQAESPPPIPEMEREPGLETATGEAPKPDETIVSPNEANDSTPKEVQKVVASERPTVLGGVKPIVVGVPSTREEIAAQIRLEMLGVALDQGKEDVALEALRGLGGDAFSNFEFISLLGAGFSGSSWLCRDKLSGKALVLKAPFDASLDSMETQRVRERTLLRESEHPCLELPEPEPEGFTDGLPGAPIGSGSFWLRPYLSGESLSQKIRRDGPLSSSEWFPIAWSILSAVRDLHSRGMLHRALCPNHIILPTNNPDLPAILIDSGEAPKRALIHPLMANPESRIATRLGRSAAKRVPFMAPEASGKPKGISWFGPPMDIYAFGMIGWYALTGTPSPSSARKEEIDPAWRQILDKCTQWIQGRRPMMMEAVMELVRNIAPEGETTRIDEGIKRAMRKRMEDLIGSQPENAEALVRMGRTLVRLEDTSGALEAFGKAIAINSELSSARLGRGLTHMMRMDPAEAVFDLAEAARLEPDRHEIFANLGTCLGKLGKTAESIEAFGKALLLVPGHPGIECEIGDAYLALGQAADAAAHFAVALATEPSNIRAFCGQAKAFIALGDHARARASWDAALKIEPNSVLVLGERSQELLHQGKNEEALTDIRQALTHAISHRADLKLNEGYALHKMGRDEEAVDRLAEAVGEFSESKALRTLLGEILLRQERYDEAMEAVRPILDASPDSPLALHILGTALSNRGDTQGAIVHFDRALEIDPTIAKTRFQRGLARVQLGDSKGGAEDFNLLVESDPTDAACRCNLGNALADQGLLDEACVHFEAGLKENPGDPHLLMGLARLKSVRGDRAGALAIHETILVDHPDFPSARVARGQSRFENGDKVGALADIEHALKSEPENPGFLSVRGSIRAAMGDMPGALLDFEQAHQIDPNRAEFLHNLAMANQSSGQYESAANLWGLFVEKFPENLNARLSRIANLTILGRLDDAREEASLAIIQNPESADALLARVDLDVSRGEYALALMDLDQVLLKHPENLQALLKRAQVLNRLCLYPDAIEDGIRALEIDPQSPRILNNHAWTLAICPKKELRNPQLARELAQKAVEVTGGKDFGIVDTLAVAVASAGDFTEAIQIATDAMKTAPEGIRGLFENRLKSFAQGIVHNPSDDEPNTWASPSRPETAPRSGEDVHDGLKEGDLHIEAGKTGDADVKP